MFVKFGCAIAASALVAFPALAGEEVIYQPAPTWIELADLESAIGAGETLVLLDKQVRIEDGVSYSFTDVAYKVENAQALSQLGTLKLSWLPDKGDLIVHRLEILRDGTTIDLLQNGAKFDVLRRETQLEKRSLDGALTATIAAPGLEVGDILRFSQTITKTDQALDGDVQTSENLMAAPGKVGFGRYQISWPEGEDVLWQVTSGVEAPIEKNAEGYKYLSVLLPVPERAEIPDDAPARFSVPPVLQAGTFSDWQDVSRTLAPHFGTEGTIVAGGEIAKQVADIKAKTKDPLTRASLALTVVQDQISYLLNGLNGGNYLPQSPADTWELRYGDCKAKSVLLLAMLREMDIEAEPVLVRARGGDMVSVFQPMPAVFDHMIVRATIGGKDYWLDGTSSGTRLESLEEVPAFSYALPLRLEGAGLIPVTQRWPSQPDRMLKVVYDFSAGVDLAVLYDVEVLANGTMGAQIAPKADEDDEEALRDFAAEYLKPLVGEGVIYQAAVTYDQSSGLARMTASGVQQSPWEFERGKGSLALDLPSTGFKFDVDRARKAWRDIPVQINGPLGLSMEVTMILPEDGEGYALEGLTDVEREAARVRIKRSTSLTGNRLVVRDGFQRIPTEIAVSELPAEKAKVARLRSGDPILRSPIGATRYWEHDPAKDSARSKKLESTYAKIISNDPEEAWGYSFRGYMRQEYHNLEGAYEDFTAALDLETTAELYAARAEVSHDMGRLQDALADAQLANDLEPSMENVLALANIHLSSGQFDQGLALLEGMGFSGEDRISVMQLRASIEGAAGRKDKGWAILEEALSERPGDPEILNGQCWFMGTLEYRLNDALDVCNNAVRSGDYGSSVLDSRALVHYRLGQSDDALADLKAALIGVPGFGSSMYLRGVILTERGDKSGKKDIRESLRVWPQVGRMFKRFGIEVPN